jgi:hypothetical protein
MQRWLRIGKLLTVMSEHTKHIVLILIRRQTSAGVTFLLYPQPKWRTPNGQPFLALPSKTTVDDDPEPFERGTSLEAFVYAVMLERLGVPDAAYVLEDELDPVEVEMPQPSTGTLMHYTVCPVEVWLEPAEHEVLRQRVDGRWLTPAEAIARQDVPPTVPAVFQMLPRRDQRIIAELAKPQEDRKPVNLGRLMLADVPARPSMEGLARKWFAKNKAGVRVLTHDWLDRILDAGDRALNLRVADPYLRYQQQGVGFTWSFFTDKDPQDIHVHGAPVVEIYGVIEGELEIWWKPYYDRGTSAWTHRVLGPGDWAEVDSLQCHFVKWQGKGKGVVFKAGPGPLAEVGKLGVKGKTKCDDCPCMKPVQLSTP